MNRFLSALALSAALLLGAADRGAAQQLPTSSSLAALEPASPGTPVNASAAATSLRRGRPILRTVGTVAASAAAFSYMQSRAEPGADLDDIRAPVAAAVAASAVSSWLFSDAPITRVVVGSLFSAIPAGAIAYYTAGLLPDDQQGNVPMIAFSVPHGLLTAVLGKSAR